MRRTSMSWVAGLLAVLVAVGSTSPAGAETVKSRPASTRLSSAIAARVAALTPPARALAQTADPAAATAPADSRSFFRTRTGVAAIVLMVAGAGYVAYSIPKDNEKVHSPIR